MSMSAASSPDTNHFAEFHALGYGPRLIPIVPPGADVSPQSTLYKRMQGDASKDARGKVPGVRGADGLWRSFPWQNHVTTPEDIEAWHAMRAGAGVRTGYGLALIDADTADSGLAKIILQCFEKHFGRGYIRVGRWPKAGFPILVKDYPYKRIVFGDNERVEILTEGRQFVAHGIHPKTGKPYEWPRGVPALKDLPETTPDALDAFLADLGQLLPNATEVTTQGGEAPEQSTLRGDPDEIERAVRATPNTSEHFPTRESYLTMGYAIRAAIPDERRAYEIFEEWALRWVSDDPDMANTPDGTAADWERMKPPYRVGADYVMSTAERLAGEAYARKSEWYDPNAIDEPALFPEIGENALKGGRKYDFLDLDRAADEALADSAAPLIKGLLDQGAMTVLYGDSNVGKTFVAMDLAYHVGAGLEYAGMKTAKGLVVYVAAEGGRGARKRAAALRLKYGARPVGFKLLASAIDLRRPDADIKPLVAALRGFGEPILLIVIDTLSRALAGGDENSSVDMGNVVRHFDVLRAATGAHVMIVHHTGKERAKGARGHSLLRAATDTEIEVAEGSIEVTKQRDLERSWSSGFGLQVQVLGVDADGDPVTSCTVALGDVVASEGASVAEEGGALTPKEREVLDAVEAVTAGDPTGASLGDIADCVDNLSKDTARKHLGKLLFKGFVTRSGRGKYVKNAEIPQNSVSSMYDAEIGQTEQRGISTYSGVLS